ncbi:hypothetical protein [Peribacillus sp. SCS-155]|uniref:hypothetical protein n=1 Tax=Peribacillus sedimenti TaxID=3115297 RepID=UPI003905E73B
MYEITSSDITIKKKLPIRQIMSLYQETKKYDGNIFFLNKYKVVDGTKLSKLVSFMLTVDENTELKVVIKGTNVQSLLEKVKECCKEKERRQITGYKLYANPSDTVEI